MRKQQYILFICIIILNIFKIKDNKLTATLKGDKITNYELLTEIKAMTCSDMLIETKENKCRAIIVLDL